MEAGFRARRRVLPGVRPGRLFDPITGRERDTSYRPALAGMSLIRPLGWNGLTGRPVVVGYAADAVADSELGYGIDSMPSDLVRHVGVYELDGANSRLLVRASDDITGLDVADVLIAGGRTRAGTVPGAAVPIGWLAVGLAGAVLVVFAVLRARQVRVARRAAPPGPAAGPIILS